ncbi:MAG: L-threonylcarbamoyladenylate synthase [Methylicorpusculum sp.]|nr:L-threonylcarbamoyladenylate synthase [Methylicorpusculum sp.]
MRPIRASSVAIERAAELLKQGGLVAFPTETVYGLGADAGNAGAVQRIFSAKGRPADHPLIVHLAYSHQLNDWAIDIPDAAFKLAQEFWPGPLAIILKKQAHVPQVVTGGQQTIGLRVPNHPVALYLLRLFGGGIAAPSANRFCRISPTCADHVEEELGDEVDMILDGGNCQVGVESTIIDLSGKRPVLIRPGHISREELQTALQMEVSFPDENKPGLRAPGLLDVHYAPVTPAIRCHSERLDEMLYELTSEGQSVGVLLYKSIFAETENLHVMQAPLKPEPYAQLLYAALRQLDHLNLDIIVVEQPPENEDWRAINDRLKKATIPR